MVLILCIIFFKLNKFYLVLVLQRVIKILLISPKIKSNQIIIAFYEEYLIKTYISINLKNIKPFFYIRNNLLKNKK